MTISIYWSFLEDEWMRAREPQQTRKEFYSKNLQESFSSMAFNQCPFTNDYLKNIYSMYSIYDYSFKVTDSSINSEYYDQEFFDKHVIIRSLEKKCFSFTQRIIFFTDQESLRVDCPIFPYLEDNNITQRCIPFTGSIDIGKYFRTIDFAFFLKDSYDTFVIEQDEVFGYIKFHTDEKIKLQQFYPSEKIKAYYSDTNKVSLNKKNFLGNSINYYKNFKLKKLILEEIKNNIL